MAVKLEMDEIETKQLYHTAWTHWGGSAQIDVLIEEMSELIHALIRARRCGREFNGAVIEEIADVSICIEQMKNRLKECDYYDEYVQQVNYKQSHLKERLMESMTDKMGRS